MKSGLAAAVFFHFNLCNNGRQRRRWATRRRQAERTKRLGRKSWLSSLSLPRSQWFIFQAERRPMLINFYGRSGELLCPLFRSRSFIASRYSAISAPPAILFLGAQIFLIIRRAHPAKGEFLRQPTRGISIKKTRAIYCRCHGAGGGRESSEWEARCCVWKRQSIKLLSRYWKAKMKAKMLKEKREARAKATFWNTPYISLPHRQRCFTFKSWRVLKIYSPPPIFAFNVDGFFVLNIVLNKLK